MYGNFEKPVPLSPGFPPPCCCPLFVAIVDYPPPVIPESNLESINVVQPLTFDARVTIQMNAIDL